MRSTLASLIVIALLTMAVSAQDEPTATGSAPEIVSLTPGEVVITGIGVALVEVVYADADGDAARFDWEMIETDMPVYRLPDGYFNQAVVGETLNVPFACTGSPYTATIGLQVVDAAGNRSEPATFMLICEAVPEADDPAGEPEAPDAPDNAGSAPSVVSIEPAETTIPGFSEIVVEVTYEDADGDAARFIWEMVETDALTWELPDGQFSQAVAGTTIPVTFFCTTPSFTASIQLVVEDAAGNQSEPALFELSCE
jgi:hypothetical protein